MPASASAVTVRPYVADDAESWLRCRVLSFLGTDYFDDVLAERPSYSDRAICLVAHDGQRIAGVMDTEITDNAATIETVAVHPDALRQGIASELLACTLQALRTSEIATVDAWTREDRAANCWYQASGFTENFRYLHVMKQHDDDDSGFGSPSGLSRPIRAFAHASMEREAELRRRYRRVYVCRQYLRTVV